MFLPNGTHIYFKNPTIEGLERLRGMIERGETITCTAVDFDGTETTHVLWHPDDPVMPLVELEPNSYGLRIPAHPPERLTWCQKIRTYFFGRRRTDHLR
jgi:hypothetical protein